MKTRIGFVSNSSSSSFIVFKDALTEEEKDMIIDYQKWVKYFIKLDFANNQEEELKERFDYCKSDPWSITVTDDYIFGQTSMDNFDMWEYFNYIKIDQNFADWDDGYNYEPIDSQLKFIKNMKQTYRKKKLDKLNNIDDV